MYDMTIFDNLTSPASMMTGTNDLTGGLLFILLIVAIFIIALALSIRRLGIANSLIVASGSTTFISILLWSGNFINDYIIIFPIIIFAK